MSRELPRALYLLFVLATLLTACSSGRPQISVDTVEFDFGDVSIGEIVQRDLTLSNTGTATLVIESVSTSCGCTTAELDEQQIPAGGNTTLHISFDGGAHGDVAEFYSRQVFIASNDPEQPELRIQFTANVIRGEN